MRKHLIVLAVLLCVPLLVWAALTDNLISFYPLTDNANDAHGSYNGTASNVTFDGTDATFNGSSSVISFNASSTVFGSLSRSYRACVSTNGYSGNPTIWAGGQVDTNKFFKIYFEGSSKKISVAFASGANFQGTTVTSTGVEYDVVVTYDGSTARLYVNGTQEGTSSVTLNTTVSTVYIGKDGIQNGDYLNGTIRQYGSWSRALTTTEVTELYNSGSCKTWPFTSATPVYFRPFIFF